MTLTREAAPLRLFLRITFPLAGLNFLTQCARAGLSVVGPALAVEYGLSASELGLLAAVMFVTYALWQLPAGVLLDVYGPRRVMTGMALTAAAGFVLFALADGMAGFVVARLVTGIGVAAGLTGLLKGNSQWFARHRLAAMTGFGMLIGSLGGMAATRPAQAVMPLIGWRGVYLAFAALALVAAAWAAISLRDPPRAPGPRPRLWREIMSFGRIVAEREFWRLTPSVALLSVMNFTYQSLWAGPWLRDVAHMDAPTRATTLLFYAVGMMAGSAGWGWAASRFTARGHSQMLIPWLCGFGLMAAHVVLILEPQDRLTVTLAWMAFACLASSGPTGYAAIAAGFPVELIARVSTAINALMLTTVFLLQSAIGWILDLWPRTASGGWDPRGYSWALGVSLTLQVVAAAWGLTRRSPSAQ